MSVKLGLGMIVKDEADKLSNILEKYAHLFHEIQITATDESAKDVIESVVRRFNASFTYYEWKHNHELFPFDEARNFNMSQFKDCEYYFRLDCDDEIIGSEHILAVAQKAKDLGITLVMCRYDYARDEWGNTVASHNRETIIKLDGNLYWNKPIHENILPKNVHIHKPVVDENIIIKHVTDDDHADKSSERNLKYLIAEYQRDKDKTDSRTLAYLGRVFTGMGEYGKAIFFLEKHIQTSGWDEDRYMSWCYLSDIYRWEKDYEKAIACAYEALSERTDYPDAYWKLHYVYADKAKWEKAIDWGKIASTKKAPTSTMISDPSSTTWRPSISMAFCFFKIGKFEEAYKFYEYAKKLAPTHAFIKENGKLFESAVQHKSFVEKFAWIANYLKDKDKEKLEHLSRAIPDELMEEPAMIGFKNLYRPIKKWNEKSVVIYCGQAWEEWGPYSVENGIGGSEEAVINMGRELTKLGYEVTVFNSCGDKEGNYDGVEYVNYYKFSKNDEFNILIAWRCNLFKYMIKAKQRILWIHDVPEYILNDYDECAQTDKAIVLSEYHKSLLVHKFPEEKIYVSANGLDTSLFNLEIPKNPHRVIYASSYDRGLEQLLQIWPDVIKEVPDAELHVFYGWHTYDKMYEEGSVDGKFKEKMLPLLSQPKVFEHGRIGHKQLADEFVKSGIWAYPTSFPEISCITAMKAQTAHCVPICTDFAALKETVKSGLVIPGVGKDPNVLFEFKMCLLEMLKNKDAQEKVREIVRTKNHDFSWAKIAQDWSDNLFSVSVPREFINCRFEWIKDRCGKDSTIIDIGGNDGHTFEGWDRSKILTVDIDEYDVPNFLRAEASSIPVPDKSYDIACLNEILEHLPDPISALKEAKRIAKRKIVITVPNEYEWPKELEPLTTVEDKVKASGKTRESLALEANKNVKDIYKVDNLEHLWHIRYYTPQLLKEHLTLAGLTDYKISKLSLGQWAFYGVEVTLND